MKIRTFAATLLLGSCAPFAFAQAPEMPAPTPAPAPVEPTAAPKKVILEGSLLKSQRLKNDKGQFEWICTYSVGSSRRSVQLDESCPATFVFELKR